MIERWQYGVRFLSDGSEAWWWSGRTSRLHAEAHIAKWGDEYPGDRYALVRRPVDHQGRPIGASSLIA